MNDASRQYEPSAALPVKERTLPEGLRFKDIETALEGRVSDGVAMTRYVPQGYATPTWIHLEEDDGETSWTLIVHPLTGRTEIIDGRVEMERKGF